MAAGETAADLLWLLEVEGLPGKLGGVGVLGLFAEPASVDPLGGLGVAIAQPQYRIAASAVPAQVADMPLEVQTPQGLRRFTVRECMPDGTGLALLKLSDAA